MARVRLEVKEWDYMAVRIRFLDAYYKAYVLSQYEDCDIWKVIKSKLSLVMKNVI